MTIVVRKYGGSSLATAEKVCGVARRLKREHRAGDREVIVVSARGDTTDDLLATASTVSGQPSRRELDQLLAVGEQASAALLAMALIEEGLRAVSLAGSQTGIRTMGPHSAGVITEIELRRTHEAFADSEIVVVAGFQGSNATGDLVTLGRGGSDTTAVAFSAALGLRAVEIRTDVAAVHSCDPRLEPNARPLSRLGTGVMAEMAFTGARVLHARAVELAAIYDIDIHVGHATEEGLGTMVSTRDNGLEESPRVLAVTHDTAVVRVVVRGAAASRVDQLAALAARGVPLEVAGRLHPTDGGDPLELIVAREHQEIVLDVLRSAGGTAGTVSVEEDIARVSVVGPGLLSRPDILAQFLRRLTDTDVAANWIATSQMRISVTIPASRVGDTVAQLHDEFDLGRDPARHSLTVA